MAKNKIKSLYKKRSFDDAIETLQKLYGEDIILSKMNESKVERIKSGLYNFDKTIGGGIPVGRVIEIFGPEGSGKTTLALELVKVYQKQKTLKGKNLCLYLDFEHAIDIQYAKKLGVDINENVWMFSQPEYLQQGIDILMVLAYTGRLGLVIVDSVATMLPKEEYEEGMGSSAMGLQARQMGRALNKMKGVLNKTKTVCIFINQVRDKIGVMFGSPETTPGGKALKFYASIRARISAKKSAEYDNCKNVTIKIVKNKTSDNQFETSNYELKPGVGFLKNHEALLMGIEKGIIKESKRSYLFGKRKFSQKDILRVLTNEKLREIIYDKKTNNQEL